jgi:trans-aconitate 2-methyltransferase
MELLRRVDLGDVRSIVDLGCGEGTVTRLLRERWAGADVVGVDSSPQMLDAARELDPRVCWVQDDISDWRPDRPVDLIFSNAALHWLDDHEALFVRLARLLEPGGVLAVQMPGNFQAPSHTELDELVRERPWRNDLGSLSRPEPVHEPAFYYDVLAPRAAFIDIWETVYLQVLTGNNPVAEWTRGTLLRPYLAALAPRRGEQLFTAYADRIRKAYPPRADGSTLFPFRRLFIVARIRE